MEAGAKVVVDLTKAEADLPPSSLPAKRMRIIVTGGADVPIVPEFEDLVCHFFPYQVECMRKRVARLQHGELLTETAELPVASASQPPN